MDEKALLQQIAQMMDDKLQIQTQAMTQMMDEKLAKQNDRLELRLAEQTEQVMQMLHDQTESVGAIIDAKLENQRTAIIRDMQFLVEQKEGRKIETLAEKITEHEDRITVLEHAMGAS